MPGKLTVHFGDVSIREFEILISDNPSVQEGAGIELGWKYNIILEHSPIDNFEEKRSKERMPYYQAQPLSWFQRRHLLHEFGFTREEIEEAKKSINMSRLEQEKSLIRYCGGWDKYDSMKEDMGVACKKMLKRGSRSRSMSRGSSLRSISRGSSLRSMAGSFRKKKHEKADEG